MKLARKLILVISATSAVSLVVVGFLTFFFLNTTLREIIGNEQLELARQAIDKVDRLLQQKYTEIQAITGDESIEEFLSAPVEDIPDEVIRRLEELTLVSGPWDNLELFNTKRDLFFSITEPEGTPNDVLFAAEEEIYQKALGGKAVYSDFIYDEDANNGISMLFAAPVRNDNAPGRPIIGVIIGHLSWPVVMEVLESTKGPLVDMYNTKGAEIGNKYRDYNILLKENNSDKEIIQKAIAQKEGSEVTEGVDGEYESLTSYATEKGFADYRGNGWFVIIETPTDIAFASTSNTVIKILLLLFPVIMLASVALVIFITRMLRPIESMTQTVTALAGGDLAKRVEVKSKDEIGILGTAFNTMASKLQEVYISLESKVKERTEELTEEEAKLEFLVKALPVGVALIRASDGKATLINNKGVELLGRGMDPKVDLKNANEIYKITKEDGTLYPAEKLPPNVALQTGLLAEAHDLYIEQPDKTKIILKTVASPLKDANGKVTSVVIVFDDITKEQEIDKAKTEFVSLASHQLRTPLSTINWYTEMLMAGDAGPINENQKKFLGEIYLGSTRMVDLVNALLNVSRLELGTFVVEPEPTDMIALARSVMDEQKPQLDERRQTIVPNLDKALPIMQVDPKLMRMVVQNLLSNAIKYTPEAGKIELVLAIDDEKENMILKVADNGYGITKNQQDKIFTKLFRADNVKARDTVGTGLGLYIVKSIIEHSGGQISFESEEDKGTTFRVSIPLSGMKKKVGEKALS